MNAQGLQEGSGKQLVWVWLNTAECVQSVGLSQETGQGSSLWGFCWWTGAHGGKKSSLCELWWQGMGVCSVGSWLEPFGGPGQGRVKASVVSAKQPACED